MGSLKVVGIVALFWLWSPTAGAFPLIADALQMTCPSPSCYQLQRNLDTDSLACSPSVESAFSPWTPDRAFEVSGTLLYFSVMRAPYRYDVFPTESGGMLIGLRIGLQNEGLNRIELESVYHKVIVAEQIWNAFAPFGLKFDFQLIDLAAHPEAPVHFSVKYTSKRSRGPYNSVWSSQWDGSMVAHEIGHMLGLNDEYEFFGGAAHCDEHSMMCAPEGQPALYHYYLIARRVHCDAKWPDALVSSSQEYNTGAFRPLGVDLHAAAPEKPINCMVDSNGQDICI